MRDALSILKQHGERIGRQLEQLLAEQTAAPPRLIESIAYSLLAGGKRLRPALVLESFAAVIEQRSGGSGQWPVASGQGSGVRGQSSQRTDRRPPIPNPPPPTHELRSSTSALAAACAIELIHTFSLVHDDLPAMDDDDLRRGKPTCHKVFGEAMAILAGDAMVTMAFEVLANGSDPDVAPRLIAELARAAGPGGMIGGQVLDMAGENRELNLDELQQVHRMKTGALLTMSCRLGAIAARASDDQLDALTSYGRHLGLAFQIVDDILDVTSTPEQLGKATHKDAGRGKNTYPALLGLDASRAEAHKQVTAATAALESFGVPADGLRTLARFVTDRRI